MMRKIFLALIIIGFSSNLYATRYYVNAGATGNGTGLTWTNAFTDLQTALSIVIFNDEIWVAAGQYKPTTTTDKTISFVLKDGVNIYGSFAGNETALGERNMTANPSTLNGDIGQAGEVNDNSYHIIRGDNITSNITLDGFRIINGHSSSSQYRGGAISYTNSMSGNLLISNCYFFSNRAVAYGGAIYIENAKMNIEDCEFRNNQTTFGGNGGAIYVLNNGNTPSLTVKKTKFIGNTSRIGACIANTSSYQNFIIDRCIFSNNTAEYNIIQIDGFINVKILNSYFIGNTVSESSAQLLSVSNAANVNTEDFEMINCTVTNNYNVYDSNIQSEMIDLYKSYYKVRNCIIYGNTKYLGRQLSPGRNVSNCLVEGGYTGGTSITNSNPLFVNPNPTINVNFDAASYDYTLSGNSPGLNTGNNSFVNALYGLDLNNADRIQGTVVDLGCYESDIALSVNNIKATDNLMYFDYTNNVLTFLNPDLFYNKTLYIYDASGRMINNQIIENSKINFNLISGVYFLKIENYETIKISVK